MCHVQITNVELENVSSAIGFATVLVLMASILQYLFDAFSSLRVLAWTLHIHQLILFSIFTAQHPPILPVSHIKLPSSPKSPSPQKPGGRGPRPLRPIRGGVKGPAFPALPDQVDRLPSIESVWRVGVGAEAGVGTVGTVLG